MTSHRTRLLVALAVFILVFSVLTLAYWDFVRQSIIIPIYYLAWLIGLVINSIPQEAWLVLLAILALLIGVDTLTQAQARPQPAPPPSRVEQSVTRYRSWVNMTRLTFASDFARQRFATETRKLVLAILSYQMGLDPGETEQKVVSGEIPVPDGVRSLVQARQLLSTRPPGSRLLGLVREWLGRLTRRRPSGQEMLVDRQVEEIILFIEGLLEINHDRNQPDPKN